MESRKSNSIACPGNRVQCEECKNDRCVQPSGQRFASDNKKCGLNLKSLKITEDTICFDCELPLFILYDNALGQRTTHAKV